MKINSNKPLPHLCKPLFSGELSDNAPYIFQAGGFRQCLIKQEWEALKQFAAPVGAPDKDVEETKETISTPLVPASSTDTLGSEDKAPETKTPEETSEEDEADKEALEALKSQYSKMKSKNNAEGRALRDKIKELESK